MSATRRQILKFASIGMAASMLLPMALTTAARAAPRSETLIIAQGNDILSLDPANHENNSTESGLINIYDYLVRKEFPNGEMTFVPGLAKSWKSDDLITWEFELRDDVKWHDGTPFTADDVKFTIERVKADQKLLSSAVKFRTVEQVNVLGPHRVQVVTSRRDPLLLHNFVGNGGLILPKHALETPEGAEKFFAKPIGTGPYRFTEWRKGDRLVLERNPEWWEGTPHWESVIVRAIPETTTRVAEALTGGVDIAVNIPPEDITRVEQNPDTGIISFNIARNFALHVRNEDGKVTSDPRVREAIDLAINRKEIAEIVAEGYATPTRGLFPAEIPGNNPDLTAENAFDPERARKLIEEAGVVGAPIKLSTPSGRWTKDREVSEAIVGYLQDAGLDAQIEVQEWSVYNSRRDADTLGELYLWGMGSYTDASVILNLALLRRFNPHWTNEEFVSLSKEIDQAPTEEARQAILRRAQEIITGDRARIGILYPKAIHSVNNRVNFAGRFDEMIPAEQVRRK
ncbi:ABC transporter substrate-binding protein [Pseudochelatococcus contaminans]|uniref:Peptide/nickel transport system substrate-binding protein n=1 Tax=Pseudochelatococcus contaminans TaxID=1538103 RepID=A0A7W5Z624_9HYPH|nr:ABC transporter substrate-binding protein [Pseudochelatococcus contaminans]MBB3810510.1 peptide/nickel transport system substrate-binding protein [Pseudochelatococcus contaminans]